MAVQNLTHLVHNTGGREISTLTDLVHTIDCPEFKF